MLYLRSSFFTWLTKVKECEMIPLGQMTRTGAVILKNGPVTAKVCTNREIDYEEIWSICNRLYIVGLPGDSDLERIE